MLAATLSACGSHSKESPTETAAAIVAPSTTRGEFTLGMICSCSGPQQSSLGDNGSAMQAWAKWVDATGGINGYPVRVIVKDDGENPATSLDYAKELVTGDHIMAIVGDSSLVDAAWANYIAGTGVPVVGGVSQEAPFLTNPDFFASGAQISPEAGVIALARAAGKTHIGVYYCAESPICAQALPPAETAARLLGIRFTAGAISGTEPSYAAPCLTAKDAGVDAVWVADNAPVVQRFVAACATQSYDPLEVGELGSATTAWLADRQLGAMELTANNADTYDPVLPALGSFRAALRRYAPGLLTSSSVVQEPNTLFAWVGGLLFEAAAKAAHLTPGSSPAQVKEGLYALRGETLGGLAPPLTFTPGRPAFVPCYFTDELKGGAFVPLNGGKPSCLSATEAHDVIAAATR
jgi:branched-chain amino acid transport system substrate-binding protein